MTDKRFSVICANDPRKEVVIDGGIKCTARYCAKLLNDLHDKCEFLEIENESFEDSALYYAELYQKTLNENEQLKKQIEELTFKLRTIEAYDRCVKKEHSDTVFEFKKKLDSW